MMGLQKLFIQSPKSGVTPPRQVRLTLPQMTTKNDPSEASRISMLPLRSKIQMCGQDFRRSFMRKLGVKVSFPCVDKQPDFYVFTDDTSAASYTSRLVRRSAAAWLEMRS